MPSGTYTFTFTDTATGATLGATKLVDEADQGHEKGNNDRADHHGEKHDHDRLEQ